jgi:hypothetical protein
MNVPRSIIEKKQKFAAKLFKDYPGVPVSEVLDKMKEKFGSGMKKGKIRQVRLEQTCLARSSRTARQLKRATKAIGNGEPSADSNTSAIVGEANSEQSSTSSYIEGEIKAAVQALRTKLPGLMRLHIVVGADGEVEMDFQCKVEIIVAAGNWPSSF